MKKIILALSICLASLVVTACVPKVDSVDYNQKSTQLSLGMTKNQVTQILGQPRRTDVNSERERWIYWNKVVYGYAVVDNEQMTNERLTVTFVNGKVTKWGQQTLADDVLESTQKTAQAYADAASSNKK